MEPRPRAARLLPLLLAALVALAPACGGSGGSPSGGTAVSTPAPGNPALPNPCTAALAATGDVTASARGAASKTDGFGHDDRDPREFLALHLLPGAAPCPPGPPRPRRRARATSPS